MRTNRLAILGLSLGIAACGGGGGGGSHRSPVFPIAFNASAFSGHVIDNPFFPLPVSKVWTYRKTTPAGLEEDVVTVTNQTKTILGVPCVVVTQRFTLAGALVEATLDWYAQDASGNVWYMGEDTKEYVNNVVVSTEGSWEAGVRGAQAGIVMLATPVVGTVYSQEFLEEVAEDFAEIVGLNDSVTVPVSTFTGCVHTRDTTPLEPAKIEQKYYARGVGTVLEIATDGSRLELVGVTP